MEEFIFKNQLQHRFRESQNVFYVELVCMNPQHLGLIYAVSGSAVGHTLLIFNFAASP